MPYIGAEDRKWVDPIIDKLVAELRGGVVTKGAMNYIVTRMMLAFIGLQSTTGPTYSDFNDAIGVLECVKLELYRRHVVPYEDKKIAENGDVTG